jgi:lipoprotein Spr
MQAFLSSLILSILSSLSLSVFAQKAEHNYSDLFEAVNTVVENDSVYKSNYFASFGIDLGKIKNPNLYNESFKWLTTPHKMGHSSKFGIDCSGFAKIIYTNVFHTKLEGGSRDIFPKTTRISPDDLQEGDLVFFKVRSQSITHVGVFLQKRIFVHTSTSSGVMLSSLDDAYWSKYFFAAGHWPNLENK